MEHAACGRAGCGGHVQPCMARACAADTAGKRQSRKTHAACVSATAAGAGCDHWIRYPRRDIRAYRKRIQDAAGPRCGVRPQPRRRILAGWAGPHQAMSCRTPRKCQVVKPACAGRLHCLAPWPAHPVRGHAQRHRHGGRFPQSAGKSRSFPKTDNGDISRCIRSAMSFEDPASAMQRRRVRKMPGVLAAKGAPTDTHARTIDLRRCRAHDDD